MRSIRQTRATFIPVTHNDKHKSPAWVADHPCRIKSDGTIAGEMIELSERFSRAVERIDAANSADPHQVADGPLQVAAEVLYSRRMSLWLEKLYPRASEALRLAARAAYSPMGSTARRLPNGPRDTIAGEPAYTHFTPMQPRRF